MSDRPVPPNSPPPPPPGRPGGPLPPPRPPGPPPGASNPPRRQLLIAGAALAAVLAMGGAALVVANGGDDDADAGTTTTTEAPATTDPTVESSASTLGTGPEFTLPVLTLPIDTAVPLTIPNLSVPASIVVSSTPFEDIPAPTEEPIGLGNDVGFDDLAQRCYDGGLIACDVLFTLAPADSTYEVYGDTCAGRQAVESSAFCAKMAWFPGPSVDLAEFVSASSEFDDAQRCWAGDMYACDVLGKSATEPGLVDVGTSCAGRQEAGLGDCAGAFPDYEVLLEP